MNLTETIAMLKSYRANFTKALILIEVANDLDKNISIGGLNMDGMPRGTKKSDPTGDMAIKLGDARAQALKASEEANASARRIINIIDNAGLTAEEHRLIYLRYIKMPERYGDRIPSWADIANELYVSNRTVHRIHASALKKIADYCNMAHNGTL